MVDRAPGKGGEQTLDREKLVGLLRATGRIQDIAQGKSPGDHEYLESLSLEQLRVLADFEESVANYILGNTPPETSKP